jgi:hypothetical protein
MPDNSNEIKLIDQIETHINKIVDLGFLRRLKGTSEQESYEVQRILKAFVDAPWLASLDTQLELYQAQLANGALVSGRAANE